MPSNAQEIYFRTCIGACNSEGYLRVYMQDVLGKVRETMYEREWTNGTEKNVVAEARLDSPIAVAFKPEHIRMFYLTNDNMLKESAYDQSKGWYEGDIGKKKFHMAPYSSMAACFLDGANMTLRCTARSLIILSRNDNTGWKELQNLGVAMPGSSITCTSFKTTHMRLRVFFQDDHHVLEEKCWDQERGWYDGHFKTASSDPVPPRASLACTSHMLGNNKVGMSLFYVCSLSLQEMKFDGQWQKGDLKVGCIPGSEVAAACWGSEKNVQMRLYFQKGEHVSGISEWMFSDGKWKAGKAALPPA
ncbi:hypothetical protein N7478_001062 [Penicillium angulare]|uniref:uncharacterized protein n=1 Tax=Penicillium angulare TaxID=116970 RepID=UPI00253F83CD|nr:uncharacterized protein N7478_001062 [Penicillium angulare]KAJ5291811.1 hypothetical protein N7478_001062 [Penicillium angulare]